MTTGSMAFSGLAACAPLPIIFIDTLSDWLVKTPSLIPIVASGNSGLI